MNAATAVLAAAMLIPLPPPQYSRPYHGRLVEIVIPLAEMARACGRPAWACAYVISPALCLVYLPAVEPGLISTPQQQRLREHELGHCNGWPGDHPDPRWT
jgi:hypothetical protein